MRQYVARLGQECKSELIVGAGMERIVEEFEIKFSSKLQQTA